VDPERSLPDTGGDEPKMIRVLVTQVRPERYRDYLEFQKNVILPAIKKSGTKDLCEN
jgi:hypothetical protein